MQEIKVVKEGDLHQNIAKFMELGDHRVSDIDEMKDVICQMIKSGYMFAMDRDRLRDAIEDFVYMCHPNDEINKDRILKSLEYEDEEESEDEYGEGYMPMMKPSDAKESTPDEEVDKVVDEVVKGNVE